MEGAKLHAMAIETIKVELAKFVDDLPWEVVEPLYAAAIEEVKEDEAVLRIRTSEDGLKIGVSLSDGIATLKPLADILLEEESEPRWIADTIEAAECSVKEAYRRFDEKYPNFYEIGPVKEPEVAA